MTRGAVALVVIAAIAAIVFGRRAAADSESDADAAFRAASARAAAGDRSGALDAFEALGRTRPVTRWTDDAWSEAARLAEATGDYARARGNLEQVIAIGDPSDQLVRRATAALARLAHATAGGRADAVVGEHARLVDSIRRGGDPRAALEQLEALARSHPDYPHITEVRLALADSWEREGSSERALSWAHAAFDGAAPADRARTGFALARTAIRLGALAAAERALDAVDTPGVDRVVLADLRAKLAAAAHRAWLRRALWLVLSVLAIAALLVLRRETGSLRAALRGLARPPVEVLYLLPIALVLVAIAQTGNPLVARAVRTITVAGTAIAWVSGVALEAARRRRNRVTRGRALSHALAAALAVACVVYLAVDRQRMIDLLAETWRSGPAPR